MTQTAMQKTGDGDFRTTEVTRGATNTPRVDILENDQELLLFADMPGVTQEQVDIRFEQGELSIHGHRGMVEPEQGYGLREMLPGDYFRTFRISEQVDGQQIWAELKDGVLTLHLPKSEKAKPRKITVKGA